MANQASAKKGAAGNDLQVPEPGEQEAEEGVSKHEQK
jgi:hypothetical protein